LAWICSVQAQVGFGVQMDPSGFGSSKGDKKKDESKVAPFVEAILQTLAPEDVAAITASTAAVKENWTRVLNHGTYKLEMLQLILMAKESKKPLKELFRQRNQKIRLAQIAKNLGLSYDHIYEEALMWRKEIDRIILSKSSGG